MAFEIAVSDVPTNGSNPWIDSLVAGGAWSDADGGRVEIYFSLKSGADPYATGMISYGYQWLDYEIAALSQAMSAWEAVANIDFILTSDESKADIWYWNVDSDDLEDLGLHELPNFGSGEPLYGVFNFEGTGWSESGLLQGGYGQVTLLHELGHGLGLAHPHDGGPSPTGTVFPGVTEAFDVYGDYALNQGIWTVMTYNSGYPQQFPGHEDDNYGWEGTPMALDIAAIQAIYGANLGYHTGDDVYVLPGANGPGTFWSCIWDAGGTDTISAAQSSEPCVIDLNPAPLVGPNAGGVVSSVAGIVGGFTIANGVVIENAIGGTGADLLVGNVAANFLDGRAGDDRLEGGEGADVVRGGAGNDVMAGGGGNDDFLFDTSLSKATNVDVIEGFELQHDRIGLHADIFAKIGDSLDRGEFRSNKKGKAQDKNDYIVYSKKKGDLYYDSNGKKKGGAVAFAELEKGLKLKASDFFVYGDDLVV